MLELPDSLEYHHLYQSLQFVVACPGTYQYDYLMWNAKSTIIPVFIAFYNGLYLPEANCEVSCTL